MQKLFFSPLDTPRLRLRKLRMEDLPLYFSRIAASKTVTQYMNWTAHCTIAESEASIRKALDRYESGQSIRWVITAKPEDALIGIIDLIPLPLQPGTCTFAYMLAQDVWGKGYGTEALKAVINYAFSVCKVQTIQADHYLENIASGKVMEKVGMQYQQTIPAKYEKGGICHDAPQYRITCSQWKDKSFPEKLDSTSKI